MWVLEYVVKFFTAKAVAKKAEQDRLKDSGEAVDALKKAKERGADEQEIIDRELDVLNGHRPNGSH